MTGRLLPLVQTAVAFVLCMLTILSRQLNTNAAMAQSAKDSSGTKHHADSWDYCNRFACPRYLVNDVTSSACLFGCRPAALGTLLNEQDCKKYCAGIQDQPQILRYTGNLTDVERKFWRSICEEGCHSGLR